MEKTLLTILPTRGRPEAARDAVVSWLDTVEEACGVTSSTIVLCIDADDRCKDYQTEVESASAKYPSVVERVLFHVGKREGLGATINRALSSYKFDYYCFIGDDHRFRTAGWDATAIELLEGITKGWGVWYGNDLLQGKNLATSFVISGKMARAAGYISVPGLKHLYIDNSVMELGRSVGQLLGGEGLVYSENIVIEHMHYSCGKSPLDARYQEVNSAEMYAHDEAVFRAWREDGLCNAVAAIRAAIEDERATGAI